QGLGGMFARGAATEILVHEKNGRSPEAGVVEGVGLALLLEAGAIVLEGVLSQAVENDTAEEAGGNDAIGIDVVAAHGHGAALNLGDNGLGGGHTVSFA